MIKSEDREMALMNTLIESIADYADNKMSETLQIRTNYQVAKLVSEIKDTIEFNDQFVPTTVYLRSSVFPPAENLH